MISNNIFSFVLIAGLLLSGALFAGEAKEYSKNGVNVTVEKINDTLKGYKAFRIRAENTAASDRSLSAKIFLHNDREKMPKGGSGSCTVFIGLTPGASKTEDKQCKEKSSSNSWIFEIVKVYNFLLK